MAERNADREDGRDPLSGTGGGSGDGRPAKGADEPPAGTPGEPPGPPDADAPKSAPEPLDEEAVWAQLVAAYGEQPDPETGRWPATGDDEPYDERKGPVKEAPDPALPEQDQPNQLNKPDQPDRTGGAGEPGRPAGSFVVYAPGVGPRDHTPAEEGPDEGHFVPPEPPPLPSIDVTARFAWLAVLGGPLLLLVMVLLRQELTWWITTLGVGGFLGGFATLVIRMKDGDDEEDDDPGRGAVV